MDEVTRKHFIVYYFPCAFPMLYILSIMRFCCPTDKLFDIRKTVTRMATWMMKKLLGSQNGNP